MTEQEPEKHSDEWWHRLYVKRFEALKQQEALAELLPWQQAAHYGGDPVCCSKAMRHLGSQCVCAFETCCPDHGDRHVGTHD